SITGADLSIIVCEPSLSGLHDLKRVGQLSSQMDVPVGVCINKADVNDSIRWRIRDHCKEMSIPILGEVPYCLDFVKSMVMGKSVVEVGSPVGDLLREIWDNVTDMLRC
ncbi:MAG TPA: (4Fe-4S)-binding protein, partial [Candidatus Methanofastidiosa archaeon]|nr:(4Fe-4S)-binding protein [Candidatus Methanofastidiosa archaeon]